MTMESYKMQPIEGAGQIFIIVIDETYGGDEETWEAVREQYRLDLEREFGGSFEDANVGPGADIPAFLTIISTTSVPLWSVLLATFFLGKPISENLEAWGQLAKKVRGFFHKPIALSRHGASIIALEAVFEEMQGIPKTVRLLNYRVGHIADAEDPATVRTDNEIQENIDTLCLGYVKHIFEIEADGQMFRVCVEGKKTNILSIFAA